MDMRKTISKHKSLTLSLVSISTSILLIIILIAANANDVLKYSYCANNGFREDQCFTEVISVPLMTCVLSVPILLTCMAVKYRKQRSSVILAICISALLALINLVVFVCMLVIHG